MRTVDWNSDTANNVKSTCYFIMQSCVAFWTIELALTGRWGWFALDMCAVFMALLLYIAMPSIRVVRQAHKEGRTIDWAGFLGLKK